MHACSARLELPSSIHLCLHVCMPAARLHRSIPPRLARLQRASRAPELHSSTHTRLQRAFRALEAKRQHACSASPPFNTSASARLQQRTSRLHTSIDIYHASRAPFLHANMPASRLPSFRAPIPPIPTRPQRVSRAHESAREQITTLLNLVGTPTRICSAPLKLEGYAAGRTGGV